MRKYAARYADWNCYVAPNPTTSTKGLRHSAKEVTHWSYFLIDVDPVHPKACNPRQALRSALNWLTAWTEVDFDEIKPIIIDSGRGMQAWIRLEDFDFEEAGTHGITRMLARRAMGYWLKRLDDTMHADYGCKVDTSVSDLPRVMRMPGTVNLKTGKPSLLVNATDHIYEGLGQTLIKLVPDTVYRDPEIPTGVKPGQKWQKVFPHLTLMAQNYLMRGQEEPGRHKVMWHTAKKLSELGVTKEEARKALTRANGLRGEDEKLPPEQVEHALDTAYEAE